MFNIKYGTINYKLFMFINFFFETNRKQIYQVNHVRLIYFLEPFGFMNNRSTKLCIKVLDISYQKI